MTPDAMAKDTLTITDNRTGKTYEVPIEDGCIRTADLRQIKVDDAGLRPDGLRPGVPQHRQLPERRSPSSTATRASSSTAATPSSSWPRSRATSRSPTCCMNGELPSKKQLDEFIHLVTHHTYVHENIKTFMDGFRYDAHPMSMLASTVAALSAFYPEAKNIKDAPEPPHPDDPPDREDADHRRLQLTATRWACRTSTRTTTLRYVGNFLAMIKKIGTEHLQGEPGPRARARRALHPPRRPRAELQHHRDPPGGLLAGGSVLGGRRGHRRALRPAPRRRQRGRAAHAPRDRPRLEGPRVHQGGEERRGRDQADGLRSPRLQELRPAREGHQARGRRGLRGHRARTRCSTSRWSSSGSRCRTTTS